MARRKATQWEKDQKKIISLFTKLGYDRAYFYGIRESKDRTDLYRIPFRVTDFHGLAIAREIELEIQGRRGMQTWKSVVTNPPEWLVKAHSGCKEQSASPQKKT